jgi:hypothetical protein
MIEGVEMTCRVATPGVQDSLNPRSGFQRGDTSMAMNLFGARDTLATRAGQKLYFYNLNKLQDQGFDISKLPVSVKVLLESVLREANDYDVPWLAGRPSTKKSKFPSSLPA